MTSSEKNRRRVLTGAAAAGLGVFVSGALSQQKPPAPRLPYAPRDSGALHRETLILIGGVLSGTPLDTKQGLYKIVDLLVQLQVVTKEQGDILKTLIDAVFEPNVDAMREKVNSIYQQLAKKAGDLAVAIASIARDSIEYARQLGARDPAMVVYIVSSDFIGALTGAAAGAKVGGQVFAVFGALAGAIAASGRAAYGTKR